MPTTFRDLQTNLHHAGYDAGAIDGLWGPKTLTALLGFAAGRQPDQRIGVLGAAMAAQLPKWQINTPLRVAHFVSQACHETGGWLHLVEMGGADYFKKYDGRQDLGNAYPGDGYRFRGRGVFQLTGRCNYAAMGVRTSFELTTDPDLAAEPAQSVVIACIFWADKGLNAYADQDGAAIITRKINGGLNGYTERVAILKRIKEAWGL